MDVDELLNNMTEEERRAAGPVLRSVFHEFNVQPQDARFERDYVAELANTGRCRDCNIFVRFNGPHEPYDGEHRHCLRCNLTLCADCYRSDDVFCPRAHYCYVCRDAKEEEDYARYRQALLARHLARKGVRVSPRQQTARE